MSSSRASNHARRSGVTLVEIMVVATIAGLISGVLFSLYRRSSSIAVEDSRNAEYYLGVGLFMEHFHNDLAMARTIHKIPDGCELEIRAPGNVETITYQRVPNGIVRKQRAMQQLFPFGKPPRTGAPLIFRIEEVPAP